MAVTNDKANLKKENGGFSRACAWIGLLGTRALLSKSGLLMNFKEKADGQKT